MNGINDFINPKSMLTPGIAGSMVMLITNTLCCQFTLAPKWIGLFLSFLLGLLVFKATTIPRWERTVYYFLNSLVIFSVAFGTAKIGSNIEKKVASNFQESFIQKHQPTLVNSLMDHLVLADHRGVRFIPAAMEIPPDHQRHIIMVQFETAVATMAIELANKRLLKNIDEKKEKIRRAKEEGKVSQKTIRQMEADLQRMEEDSEKLSESLKKLTEKEQTKKSESLFFKDW